MDSSRRFAVAGLGAGFCLALAGCEPRPSPGLPGRANLDVPRLAAGFADLLARARPAAFGLGVGLIDPVLGWVSDPAARWPLQSVFKVFLAGAVLSQVDAGHLRLNEPVTLTEEDLSPGAGAIDKVWSTRGAGRIMTLPAVDLIALAIQLGDNTAADALMKRLGGPGAVTDWLRGKGLGEIRVDRYERDLQQEATGMPPFRPEWKDPSAWLAARDAVPAEIREAATARYLADPRDTATLPASIDYLTRLARGELLSPTSTRLLLRLMSDTKTGQDRLQAGLPPGASLAHKTGSAATDLGLTPATNDIGIVTLANGRRFVLAAYLAGSAATEAARDHLVADAAALASACIT